MHKFALVLKCSAPVFIVVGALHLFLGIGADVILGAKLSAAAIADPVLDSQNRFYGVSFSLYGVLLYLCSTDIVKYHAVLKCVIWVFFAAGVARLLSIAVYGVPSAAVLILLSSELVLPPLLAIWLHRLLNKA